MSYWLSYFDIGGINDTLDQYYLQNAHIIVTLAVAVSFISYYSLAGWFQWTYYIKRKDKVSSRYLLIQACSYVPAFSNTTTLAKQNKN